MHVNGDAPADYPFRTLKLTKGAAWWPPQRAWLPGSATLRTWLLARQVAVHLNLTPADRLLICLHTAEHKIAARLSRLRDVPLVALLHDMWDAKAEGGIRGTLRLCACVLPVSNGLASAAAKLGARRIRRMLPIGEDFLGTPRTRDNGPRVMGPLVSGPLVLGPLVLGIAGSMSDDYIQAAQLIAPDVVAIGGDRTMSRDERVQVVSRFAENRGALLHLAECCDALVVYQTFDLSKAHLSYSFPSRLIDFAQTGLPIVLCAPRESELGAWAMENDWDLWIADPNDEAKIRFVKAELSSPEHWQAWSERTTRLARGQFRPDAIHAILEEALRIDPMPWPSAANMSAKAMK